MAKAFFFSFFEFRNQVSSVVSIQTHPFEALFYLLGDFMLLIHLSFNFSDTKISNLEILDNKDRHHL